MRSARKLTRTGLVTLGVLAGGLLVSAAPALAAEQWRVIDTFGGSTSTPANPQPLSGPDWLAINQSTNDVYVVDKGNNRVEWFDSAGKYEGQFNGSATPAESFSSPGEIAVDNDPSSPSFGDVYVIDTGHKVVDKFSASGAYLGQITTGAGGVPFGELLGVAVDSGGKVWISQAGGEIDAYSNAPANTFVSELPQGFNYVILNAYIGSGLAVNAAGDLYVGTAEFYGVTEYSPEGKEIASNLGDAGESGQSSPTGFSLDPAIAGDVFIDTGTSVGLSSSVERAPFIESFGEGPLSDGVGVAVDAAGGDLYLAEPSGSRVLVFARSSTPQTPPSATSISTEAATEVTGATWTFHGKLNPEAAVGGVGYYFSYNAGAGSTCTGPESARTSFDSGIANVTGTTPVAVSATVKLQPHEKYSFCLVADGYGATAGPQQTLKTGGAAPEIISESAATVAEEESNLVFSAVINPNRSEQETKYYFEYSTQGSVAGNTLTGKIETAPEEPGSISAGLYEGVEVPTEVKFLNTNYTYYYRVVATNETGTETGKVEAYTKLPEVVSESSAGLTLTDATLEAKINPDYKGTKYHFEYATDREALEKGQGTQVPGAEPVEGEFVAGGSPVSVTVGGLQPNTPYYYRVVIENAVTKFAGNINEGHPIAGKIKSFTTESLPFVSTGEAQSITRTSAALAGTITPLDQATTYYFQYIGEAGYQAALKGDAEEKADPFTVGETTAPVNLGASAAAQVAGPLSVGGLLPGETYHYRLVAKNKFGWEYGQPQTFKTGAAVLPGVSTGGASAVSQNAATLSGTVSTNGLQTNYGFEIGTEPNNYGPATGLGAIGGAATEEVRVTLGELQPGTTYYYRVEATNADGTETGQPESFTTPGFPTLLSAPTSTPLIAVPNIVFPKEEAGTTGTSTIAVVSHKVKGHTATLEVSVPSAGKLVATGKGVSKGTGKASKAGDVTVKVTLTKAEQARLAKHGGRKLSAKINLQFTPTTGAKLTTSVTVLIG